MEILEEINKAVDFQVELDLGFNIQEFKSGYSKRFFTANFINTSIVLQLNVSELNLFQIWYTETLHLGVEEFEADFGFGFGVQTYTFIEEPQINNIQANEYSVRCLLLQRKGLPSIDCLDLKSCQDDMLRTLTSINTAIVANVEASPEKKRLYICSTNLINMISFDINTHSDIYNI